MHHQPGRLVDDNDVLVGIDDVERDIFRRGFGLCFRLDQQLDLFAALDHGARRHTCLAVDEDLALFQPSGQARAGVVREALGDGLIKAHTVLLGRQHGAIRISLVGIQGIVEFGG